MSTIPNPSPLATAEAAPGEPVSGDAGGPAPVEAKGPPVPPEGLPRGMMLHMGIAEQGKVYALQGNHALALGYYRQAMHMAVQAGDPEVFFRHYLECVIESLEQSGAYAEVLAYCDKAIGHYADHPPPNPLAVRDLATIHERRGVILMKMGDSDGAKAALRTALDIVRKARQTLPLGQMLSRWVESGLHVDVARIVTEQRRHGYFNVRPDTVEPQRAIRLPNEAALLGRKL